MRFALNGKSPPMAVHEGVESPAKMLCKAISNINTIGAADLATLA